MKRKFVIRKRSRARRGRSGKEEWSGGHADLSDVDLRSHRQRRAAARDRDATATTRATAIRPTRWPRRRWRRLEGVDAALTFASGMGAITTTIMALLKAGDHIVAQRDIYGGVTKFLSQWLPKLGD